MKRIIPLIAALTFTAALPATAQVGGGIAPISPATPGLPTPTAPGMDPTKPIPVPQGTGSASGHGNASSSSRGNGTFDGSASGTLGGDTMDGGGSGIRGSMKVDGRTTGSGTLDGLDTGKTRGMNGSLPDGSATGTSRDGGNLGLNGNATATGRSGTNSANGGRFDINSGTEMSMQTELGLTAAQAKAVREYRDANGPLTNASQLRQIKGMGPKTRERMKDRLNFGEDSNSTTR